ncbi:hypothetical protein JCM11491_005028 [Sporobolomyces phaffii]
MESLPPELVVDIVASVALPRSCLASLCLVNHSFLSLVRPLLYRDLSLRLGTRGRLAWPHDLALARLVARSPLHAQCVHRLDLFLGDFSPPDFVDFERLLAATTALDHLALSEGRYCRTEFCERIVDLVALHCPTLRALHLTQFALSEREVSHALTAPLAATLQDLSLSLVPPSADPEPDPVSTSLGRLVSLEVVSPIGRPTFERLFASSFATLASLALLLDDAARSTPPPDLSKLVSLVHLALRSGPASRGTIDLPSGALARVLASAAASLGALRSLSVTIPRRTPSDRRPVALALLLESVVPAHHKTLESLEVVASGAEHLAWSTLLASRVHSCPRLGRLRLGLVQGTDARRSARAYFGCDEPERAYGIEIEWVPAV